MSLPSFNCIDDGLLLLQHKRNIVNGWQVIFTIEIVYSDLETVLICYNTDNFVDMYVYVLQTIGYVLHFNLQKFTTPI